MSEQNKKLYELDVTWSCEARVLVEATSLEEATQLVNDAPLPDGEYMQDSFHVFLNPVGINEIPKICEQCGTGAVVQDPEGYYQICQECGTEWVLITR